MHRAGEGAAYTGLKPVGIDFGPVIPAAEKAIASGDLDNVRSILVDELQHGLNARFEHILYTRSSVLEPKNPAEVAAARDRVSAELGFVTFAEGMRQAVIHYRALFADLLQTQDPREAGHHHPEMRTSA